MTKAAKDKAPVYFRRVGWALVPELQIDVEALAKIPVNARVRVEISEPRSVNRLRLYWRMLAYVRDATDCAPTSEHLHSAIKLELGYGIPVRLSSGVKVLVPGSIAFDKMSEDEFRGFFDRAVAFLTETFGFNALQFYDEERESA